MLFRLVKSILRQANFKGAKLLGASFFDSDLTGMLYQTLFEHIKFLHVPFELLFTFCL